MKVWRQTEAARLSAAKTEEARKVARHSQGLISKTDSYRESMVERGRRQLPVLQAGLLKSPLTTKGEKNHSAKRWIVRSPENVVYDFVCLAEFIRSNPHLLPDETTRWYGPSTNTCAALIGISSLHPLRVRPKGSWRGWTWVSDAEGHIGNNDLLNRHA